MKYISIMAQRNRIRRTQKREKFRILVKPDALAPEPFDVGNRPSHDPRGADRTSYLMGMYNQCKSRTAFELQHLPAETGGCGAMTGPAEFPHEPTNNQ